MGKLELPSLSTTCKLSSAARHSLLPNQAMLTTLIFIFHQTRACCCRRCDLFRREAPVSPGDDESPLCVITHASRPYALSNAVQTGSGRGAGLDVDSLDVGESKNIVHGPHRRPSCLRPICAVCSRGFGNHFCVGHKLFANAPMRRWHTEDWCAAAVKARPTGVPVAGTMCGICSGGSHVIPLLGHFHADVYTLSLN